MTRSILINILILLCCWFGGFSSGGGFANANLGPLWLVILSLISLIVTGIIIGVADSIRTGKLNFYHHVIDNMYAEQNGVKVKLTEMLRVLIMNKGKK